MPSRLVVFVCDFCGGDHVSYSDALDCETGHAAVVGILRRIGTPQAPRQPGDTPKPDTTNESGA